MKAVAYVLMVVFGLLGLILIAAANQADFTGRLIKGLVCLAVSVVLGYLAAMRPVNITHVQKLKVDLSGNVNLEKIQCQQCGAELDSKSVDVAAGAVFVKCAYCGAQYQLEEEAKW